MTKMLPAREIPLGIALKAKQKGVCLETLAGVSTPVVKQHTAGCESLSNQKHLIGSNVAR